MSPLTMALLGALTGLHAATWGAFKDSPFEGFRMRSFVRSVAVGAAGGMLVGSVTDLGSTVPPVVVLGVLYAVERLATEWWKTFLREDAQSAYTIPMRLALLGRPVDARLPRYTAGLAVAALLGGGAAATHVVGPAASSAMWLTLLAGGLGGWLTAVGGAWKDAPVEGFSGWKFLRSPVVATAWACLLLGGTTDWLILAVAAGGLAVLSIETYKTFLTGGRPPGKFSGKPVRFTHARVRRTCRMVHAGWYLVLAWWLLTTALPEELLRGLVEHLSVSTGGVAVVAVLLSLLVVGSRSTAPAASPDVTEVDQRSAGHLAMLGQWPTHAAPRPESAQNTDAHVDLRRKGT